MVSGQALLALSGKLQLALFQGKELLGVEAIETSGYFVDTDIKKPQIALEYEGDSLSFHNVEVIVGTVNYKCSCLSKWLT